MSWFGWSESAPPARQRSRSPGGSLAPEPFTSENHLRLSLRIRAFAEALDHTHQLKDFVPGARRGWEGELVIHEMPEGVELRVYSAAILVRESVAEGQVALSTLPLLSQVGEVYRLDLENSRYTILRNVLDADEWKFVGVDYGHSPYYTTFQLQNKREGFPDPVTVRFYRIKAPSDASSQTNPQHRSRSRSRNANLAPPYPSSSSRSHSRSSRHRSPSARGADHRIRGVPPGATFDFTTPSHGLVQRLPSGRWAGLRGLSAQREGDPPPALFRPGQSGASRGQQPARPHTFTRETVELLRLRTRAFLSMLNEHHRFREADPLDEVEFSDLTVRVVHLPRSTPSARANSSASLPSPSLPPPRGRRPSRPRSRSPQPTSSRRTGSTDKPPLPPFRPRSPSPAKPERPPTPVEPRWAGEMTVFLSGIWRHTSDLPNGGLEAVPTPFRHNLDARALLLPGQESEDAQLVDPVKVEIDSLRAPNGAFPLSDQYPDLWIYNRRHGCSQGETNHRRGIVRFFETRWVLHTASGDFFLVNFVLKRDREVWEGGVRDGAMEEHALGRPRRVTVLKSQQRQEAARLAGERF